jgi:streptogrisin D
MTTRRTLLFAAVLAVATTMGPLPAAQAAPQPTTWQRMLAQQPLIHAADVIQARVRAGFDKGFAGIVLQDDHVALWWKGAVPAEITRAIHEAEATAPVEIERAKYSNAELKAAAEVIEARRGKEVHAIKIPADGSGLVLGTTSAVATRALTSSVDVPVRTVVEAPLAPVSRQNDSPPWKGGATIVLGGTAACTSGFSVRDGNNARYLLTAGHCGNPGARVTDPTGEFIGNVGAKHSDHDILLIPTGNVVNQQYLGNGDSNTTTPVRGWGDVFTNEILCQSGVTSARETGGPVCNIRVLFFYADREDLVEGEQQNGQQAARPGDSGGPVYGPSSAGGVIAKGTVTRVAGARIGFQDFRTANRDFGVYIPL